MSILKNKKYINSIKVVSIEKSKKLGYKLAKSRFLNKKVNLKEIEVFVDKYFNTLDDNASGVIVPFIAPNGNKISLVFLEEDLEIKHNKQPLNRKIKINSIVYVINNKDNSKLSKEIPYTVLSIDNNSSACEHRKIVEIQDEKGECFLTYKGNIKIKDTDAMAKKIKNKEMVAA